MLSGLLSSELLKTWSWVATTLVVCVVGFTEASLGVSLEKVT